MSVDVEGFELNVLKGNDWDKYRPKVLVLEAVAPNRQDIITYHTFKPFLENVGYKLRYFDGLNVFFTDTKSTNISDECFYPPNCFDDFQKYSNIENLKKEIEKINIDNEFYFENKLTEKTYKKLLKLRTKDIINVFFKRILNKFNK